MRNIKLFSLLLVVFTNSVKGEYKTQKLSDCEIIPLSVYNCDDSGYMNYQMTLKSTDDNGGKAVDLIFDPEETINADYTVVGKIDKYSDNAWQENVYNYDGDVCSLIKKFIPKVWEKFKKHTKPQIEAECQVEPGHYEAENFELSPEDFDVPAAMYGRFRVKVQVKNSDGDLIICQIIEVEIRDKSGS